MKEVTFFQKNIEPVIIYDNEDLSLEDYSKKLSKILEVNDVSILFGNESSLIVRPSKVISILIKEIPQDKNNVPKEISSEETKIISKDVITDA